MISVFINRKSGTAHVERSCEGLDGVPDRALRLVTWDSREDPPLRWCRRCAGPTARVQPARSAQPAQPA
jgi:hypothetical protein